MDNPGQLQKIRRNLLSIRRGATPSEMSERIRELCEVNGYDPVFEMMELVRNGYEIRVKDSNGDMQTDMVPLDSKDLINIHKDMMKYIYPTLKSVDIQGNINANVTVTVKKYPQPFDGKGRAIDADFSMVGEKVTENLQKIMEDAV